MAHTSSRRADPGGAPASAADAFPARHHPRPQVRDLPDSPARYRRYVGPGIIAAGVGLSSGEFILYPYIASQVGLVFVWAAVVGLVTQFFLNLEVERYALATGETALTGFSRYWRHWGLVFALLTYFANLWPGWAISSATLLSYIFGGEPRIIGIALLLVIGAILTLAPVVYVALERAQMLKIAAVALLFVIGGIFAVGASAWSDLPQAVTRATVPVPELTFALLLGALAFAGGGGGQNLVQANWMRDKGFGMGAFVPRLVSPVTGQPEAQPGTSYIFGQVLGERVGSWFTYFFWFFGAFSLFSAALGIVDYTSRMAADVIKTSYERDANESTVYARLVWGLVAIGIVVLAVGFDQPIVLLVISAVVGGFMMAIYSGLLILENRRTLPAPIRIRGFRLGVMVWSSLLFGTLFVITLVDRLSQLGS